MHHSLHRDSRQVRHKNIKQSVQLSSQNGVRIEEPTFYPKPQVAQTTKSYQTFKFPESKKLDQTHDSKVSLSEKCGSIPNPLEDQVIITDLQDAPISQ